MEYDIIGFCSENYKGGYEFSIESWLATNARKIYIYTDGWSDDTRNGRIEFINITQKDTEWVVNTGKKVDCILDYWNREGTLDNFCFLDVDNLIVSDISEVFDMIETVGLTRIYTRTTSAGNVFFTKNNLSKKFLDEWAVKQEEHKQSKDWTGHHGTAYDQWSLHELTKNDIDNANVYKITSLDEKIWNCEHDSIDAWCQLILQNRCKLLHFKMERWKNAKLVNYIKNILKTYN
jgi:hypothetical protein